MGNTAASAVHRILVVDDHPLMRDAFRDLLEEERDLEIVGESESISKAVQLLEERKPDLLLVDISLEDGNGLELIKQARALLPEILIVVVSMHDERLYAERALRAGASGYVSKHEPADVILEGIRQVLSGHIFVSDRMQDRLLRRLQEGGEEVDRSAVESLSDRELEVFEMIGQGLATREIAAKLNLSVKTVDTHRHRIKEKLNIGSGSQLVRHAVRWSLENE
jgi:DNA-binding NarL/FixJ family response regulator